MKATIIDKLLLLLICFIGTSTAAFAYLDPGTGSLIIQVMIAGFLASLMFFKRIWWYIKGLFGKRSSDDE